MPKLNRPSVWFCGALSVAILNGQVCLADPPGFDLRTSQSVIESDTEESVGILAEDEQSYSVDSPSGTDTEIIRERFRSGKVRVERQVALDDKGNFVNHGSYQQFDEKGSVIAVGQYEMGERTGSWMKVCEVKDSKIFETYPFNKLKAPFQCTVDFQNDKMNGVWSIRDADNRLAFQIPLLNGQRNGRATFFHVTGDVLSQADYKLGVLEGAYLEWDANKKPVREEIYTHGQRSYTEYDPKVVSAGKTTSPKLVKSEIQHLTPVQEITELDNWDKVTLATYRSQGESIKHGEFTYYHENGQIKTKGNYLRGVLDGEFESYYPSGQTESKGVYRSGLQQGRWTWWHPNGMRKALANYDSGKSVGTLMSWNEEGKKVELKEKNVSTTAPSTAPVKSKTAQSTPSSTR